MATHDGKTALVIDDFPSARRIIKLALEEIGFECLEAFDVDQALGILQNNNVDLVVADTFMPGKNGFDVLREMRDFPETSDIDVVLTMMEAHETLINEGEELGMSGYIVKPFDISTLSKALDRIDQKKE